ncbi:hypothetical protein B0T10DRAFT_501385 [Thelonectria olida]|uniref:Uncharacterized protein n=1 Tax=Thelonectria olida TaxID=1576542 RepID=A0A9P9AH35_9HYPO|nr:hypothetical protein B0T10DRAFT_501385 [Thelonectria olida]
MNHVEPTEFSHKATEFIHRVQAIQLDLTHSRLKFESSVRDYQHDMNRTESLLSQLLRDVRASLPPPSRFTQEPPDTISSDDEQDVKLKEDRELEACQTRNGARCPHLECLGRDKLFKRRENLVRHYTRHLLCDDECAVCERRIINESDRRQHIGTCLKPDHEGWKSAQQAWREALGIAKGFIDRASTKRPRAAEESLRSRKAQKLAGDPQGPTVGIPRAQILDAPSDTPARVPLDMQTSSEGFGMLHAPPDRAPFCNYYTMETHPSLNTLPPGVPPDRALHSTHAPPHAPERALFSDCYTLDLRQEDLEAFVEQTWAAGTSATVDSSTVPSQQPSIVSVQQGA